MNKQTLADVFSGPELKEASERLFQRADLEKATGLSAAETLADTRELVGSLADTAMQQLLDVSLEDILLGAWNRLLDIREYATGDKLASEQTHEYQLTQHRVTSKHSPKVELFVLEQKVAEVSIEISLALLVARTRLLIKQGRIMEIRISGCQASGSISWFGQTLVEKKSAELQLPRSIALGEGVPIPRPLKRKVN